MTEDVHIRVYADEDAQPVRDLFVAVNRELAPEHFKARFETYAEESVRQEIGRIKAYYTDQGGSFWIAEQRGQLVGMFGLERHDDCRFELRRMYVAPDARRQGIARLMLTFAENRCRDAGATELRLSTSELQHAAVSLYRDCGYTLTGEEVADTPTLKTIGGGIRRFHFKKML